MISVCIPTIRLEKAARCIDAVMNEGIKVEVLADEDIDRIGCPKMLKRLVEKSTGTMVMFLGDDTIPKPGFIKAALKDMATLPDGWGVVGLNSQKSRHAAHFLADKRMLRLLPDGDFFNTAYRHCFCDHELSDIAEENGRFIFSDDSVIVHDHPIFTKEPGDADYLRVYDQAYWKHDQRLYIKRKRERLNKFAIGFPLVDPMIRVNFFISFSCMEKPSNYAFLVPEYPHGRFAETLAEARNSLVEQAQWEGCSHLFMMDTDQVYPADTLTKLRSHGKDICGVLVQRRYPPFDPIFLRREKGGGRFYAIPDEEMFSGKLVEIDATGTGALLFNMAIFEKIEEPWFKVEVNPEGRTGEDVYFCMKAKEAGFRIFVDTSIEVDHLTTIAINRSLYEMYKLFNKKGGQQDANSSR